MADTKPVPVRLDDAVIARLDRVAKRLGSNRAAIMKFLVKTFLDSFEARGGLASLPHDWREIMHQLDGRTFGQLRVAEGPGDSESGSTQQNQVNYDPKAAKKQKKK